MAYNTVLFTGLFAAVWLIKRVFRKQLNARLQYMLWGILVLRLLIPFSITTQWSIFLLAPPSGLAQPTVSEQADSEDAASNLPLQVTVPQIGPADHIGQTAQYDQASEPQKGLNTVPKVQGGAPIRMDWMALIISIWLVGATVLGIRFAYRSRRLKKTVMRSRVGTTPEWMCDLFEKCRDELGLSKRIYMTIQSGLPVPAVTGVWKPLLLVPEVLAREKNIERVRHVFMHELMHCKRQDIAALWLLNALCAVYWFNPLVWLSGKLIRRDMEAACDEMVVKKLGITQRQGYIETILHFSGKNEFAHAQAAMSLNDGCMRMQIRIRSMYMKQTTKRMKAAVCALALMMLFGTFTAGCQPTPEKVIVQPKNNDSVAQAIAQSSGEADEIHTFAAPATWQDEAHDEAKSIDITIDANVVVPVDTWGLYQLIPVAASKEDTGEMLKAIVGDAPIFSEETLQSKDMLIQQIALMKSQESDISAKLKEGFDKLLADMEEKLKTAPDEETVIKEPINLDNLFNLNATVEEARANGIMLKKQGDNITAKVNGTVDMGRQTSAAIYLQYGKKGYGDCVTIDFTDYDDYEQGFFMGEDYTGQELFKCDIDVNDAAEMARKKVEELGFGYLDIAKTQVCEMLDRNRMENDKYPQCYEFIFTRKLDGAITTYRQGDFMPLEYTPLWDLYEAIVRVDDSGIIGINIESAKSDVIRQAYGIELKDFSDIMDIFKQQVFVENVYAGPGDMDKIVKREIHVTEIRLGYMPVPWKDHEGKMLFTPVWDFFGDEVTTFEEGIGDNLAEFLDENNAYHNNLRNQSLLTINALDGTIIDCDTCS